MVIISVVSCRVQENGASVPGRARNRMPGSAATAQYRTCRPGYGGNARWTRRIGPDSRAWPWTHPGR